MPMPPATNRAGRCTLLGARVNVPPTCTLTCVHTVCTRQPMTVCPGVSMLARREREACKQAASLLQGVPSATNGLSAAPCGQARRGGAPTVRMGAGLLLHTSQKCLIAAGRLALSRWNSRLHSARQARGSQPTAQAQRTGCRQHPAQAQQQCRLMQQAQLAVVGLLASGPAHHCELEAFHGGGLLPDALDRCSDQLRHCDCGGCWIERGGDTEGGCFCLKNLLPTSPW